MILTEEEKRFLFLCFADSSVNRWHEVVGFEGREIDMIRRLEKNGYLFVKGPFNRPPFVGPVWDCRLTKHGMNSIEGVRIRKRRRTSMIDGIVLSNFLSYGRQTRELSLKQLNVIIGPNGVGKSNLIDAIELLQAMPSDIGYAIRKNGGADALINNRKENGYPATIGVRLSPYDTLCKPYYTFSFSSQYGRMSIEAEGLENMIRPVASKQGELYFSVGSFGAYVSENGRRHRLTSINHSRSLLSQVRDPIRYAELTRVADDFSSIRIYRDWEFGRNSSVRKPGDGTQPSDFLSSDCSNLGVVLSDLQQYPDVKRRLIDGLCLLYPGIRDYIIKLNGGSVQVFLVEGDRMIPLSRLSDGTIRFLCLLTVLFHPNPPPLICVEEPELGLHPDVIPYVADLLKAASRHCQLIVTTHSDILIDALSDVPESVLVASRNVRCETALTRLRPSQLRIWLEKYRLGQLWLRGDIGGVRE